MSKIRYLVNSTWKNHRTTVFNIYSLIGVIITLIFSFLFLCFPKVISVDYKVSSLLSVSVTGLSFTFALFVAVRNVFDIPELGHIYLVSRTHEKLKNTFKEIFVPYVWTSFLWLVLVAISISSMIFRFNVFINKASIQYFKGLTLILVLVAALNIFGLVSDTIHDTQKKAKRASEDEADRICKESNNNQ